MSRLSVHEEEERAEVTHLIGGKSICIEDKTQGEKSIFSLP